MVHYRNSVLGVLKKAGFFLSVLIGIVFFIFFLFQALPGPEQMLSGQRTDKATTDAIVKELKLDQPVYIQAISYLNDVSFLSCYPNSQIPKEVKGCFFGAFGYQWGIKWPYLRTSFQNKQPVSVLLGEAFIGTLFLSFSSMLLALIIGIPLGIIAARHKNSALDHIIVACSTFGISVPSFFSAMLFSWIFGYVLHEYTGLPMTGSWLEVTHSGEGSFFRWSHLILPALALGVRPLAVFIQLTRNNMVEILTLDFIQTARAKGVSEKKVILRHALPNAMNPLITAIGGWLSSLLAGSFFIEYIFQWKGIGKVSIEAMQQSDFPVVMGAVLLTACLFFIINQFTEWLYVWVDPRLKHG
jgi:peptide/nickel transport system permease protein